MDTRLGRPPQTILIADDDALERRLWRNELVRLARFSEILEAQHGLEAVEVARQRQPDWVLLDLHMPHMDGWASLPKILRWAPQARVIVMSSEPREENALQALRGGATAYLEKYASWHRTYEEFCVLLDAGREVPAGFRLPDVLGSSQPRPSDD